MLGLTSTIWRLYSKTRWRGGPEVGICIVISDVIFMMYLGYDLIGGYFMWDTIVIMEEGNHPHTC